jgi:hypothetical protein
MAHTLECGYSYMAVVGFDAGDPFYDTLHGKLQVMTRMYVVDEEGFTVFLNPTIRLAAVSASHAFLLFKAAY